MLGITNSPIFGFRATADNPLFGATHNPFDLTRNSGGSSGGSAAAGRRHDPIGGANDGGGSSASVGLVRRVRFPKFLRPRARGRAAQRLRLGLAFVYDGAVTRTVEDGALAMTALATYDSADV